MGMSRFAVLGLVGASLVAACGSGSSSTATALLADGCRTGTGVSAQATTKSYVIQVDVGSVETMFTQAQVASQHPTEGEVMLRGQMSDVGGPMAGMPGMGSTVTAADRHLEAHICSRATGAIVQNANPTITIVDDATKKVSQDVPIAVMQGVTAGLSDYHYGNNVVLNPGASYAVTIALDGETATVHLRMPAATAAGTPTTNMPGNPTTTADMSGMPGMSGGTSSTSTTAAG